MKKIKEMNTIEKTHFFIIIFVRFATILAFLSALYTLNWLIVAITFISFILTFGSEIFEKKYKIDIPIELEIIIIIFIFASLILGEVHGYYTKFWWWDIILHAGASIALGFTGFLILFILYKGKKINAKPCTIVIFSFCFALALGALWEIFEFSMDQIFGFNMQKSGLIDTMWDLIVDSLGALIASITGFIYLKKGKMLIIDNIIKQFIKANKFLFR